MHTIDKGLGINETGFLKWSCMRHLSIAVNGGQRVPQFGEGETRTEKHMHASSFQSLEKCLISKQHFLLTQTADAHTKNGSENVVHSKYSVHLN